MFVLAFAQIRASELADEVDGRMEQPARFHTVEKFFEDREMNDFGDVL